MYSVEVSSYYGKKFLWEVVEDNAIEEGKKHDEIVLKGFGFNLFNKGEAGVVRKYYLVSILIY